MGDTILGLGEFLDATGQRSGEAVAYDADDLTTHGVIVGMTGSGKTGLGMVLLEEALSAGIPTLILDPKGDMGNLLLTFPQLRPEDFAPWVPQGQDPAQMATSWAEGLASWGVDPQRIAQLREKNRFVVYTPGSSSGVPLNIVGSLAPPASSDPETLQDEIDALVAGFLGLVGIESDPISSREHILMANLIGAAWAAGQSMDLPTLLTQIQNPPMRKLGVIDLDQFFPPADRTALMMKLNGLLASPAFAAWGTGAPLDIPSLLWDPSGRPSASVVYLAHLSDEERQMVVSLIMSKLVTWMRTQPGSAKLRVLVYMDEVFGFVPPTAAPPAKKPILTLFKQARAFGVGVVLATQNPVDLDYKAISNAGTWMIGRLQTERDKARLMEGLSAASGNVDVATLETTISGLGKRQFMLHTTKGTAPRLFGVRWAMSYLCGPLSRDQLKQLPGQAEAATALTPAAGAAQGTTPAATQQMAATAVPGVAAAGAGATASSAPSAAVGSTPAAGVGALADDETPNPPKVADGIPIRFLDPAAPWASQIAAVPGGRRLQAAIAVRCALLYDEGDLRQTETFEAVFAPLSAEATGATATVVDYDDRDLRTEMPPGTVFVLPTVKIDDKKLYSGLVESLRDHLLRERTLDLPLNPTLKLTGRPGETAEAFALRCTAAADDAADAEADELRKKSQTKLKRIQEQLARARSMQEQAEADAQAAKSDSVLGAAGSVLGALFGGRRRASSIATAVRGVARGQSRTAKASNRADQYAAQVVDKQAEIDDLENEVADAIVEIDDRWTAAAAEVQTQRIPLEKSDITVEQTVLFWYPTA